MVVMSEMICFSPSDLAHFGCSCIATKNGLITILSMYWTNETIYCTIETIYCTNETLHCTNETMYCNNKTMYCANETMYCTDD